jgi:hypothetical protein
VHQCVLGYQAFIAAGAAALPFDGSLFISVGCWIKSGEPAEPPPSQVLVMEMLLSLAPAAYGLPRLKLFGGENRPMAAVTLTKPSDSAVFVFRPPDGDKLSEASACQIFGNASISRGFFRLASTVGDGASLQTFRIDYHLASALTAAKPFGITFFSIFNSIKCRQFPKSFPFQVKISAHFLTQKFRFNFYLSYEIYKGS